MATHANYDFTDANTEVAYFNDSYYICRSRPVLDGTTPFQAGTWDSWNHGISPGPEDVEVSISGGELLAQLKNDWEPWGLGRLQMDQREPSVGTKSYYERSKMKLPASMQPYTNYGPTWYGFKEYRIGYNWIRENDTQFQCNIFNPNGQDYLLFAPSMNHYIFTQPAPAVTGSYQNSWFDNPTVRVPIDEEFELETLIRSDLVDGRWLCRIKLAGEPWQTLWDYQGNTLHPDETVGEDIKLLNPIKVYTNSTFVNWMNDNAGECALVCSRLTSWTGT